MEDAMADPPEGRRVGHLPPKEAGKFVGNEEVQKNVDVCMKEEVEESDPSYQLSDDAKEEEEYGEGNMLFDGSFDAEKKLLELMVEASSTAALNVPPFGLRKEDSPWTKKTPSARRRIGDRRNEKKMEARVSHSPRLPTNFDKPTPRFIRELVKEGGAKWGLSKWHEVSCMRSPHGDGKFDNVIDFMELTKSRAANLDANLDGPGDCLDDGLGTCAPNGPTPLPNILAAGYPAPTVPCADGPQPLEILRSQVITPRLFPCPSPLSPVHHTSLPPNTHRLPWPAHPPNISYPPRPAHPPISPRLPMPQTA